MYYSTLSKNKQKSSGEIGHPYFTPYLMGMAANICSRSSVSLACKSQQLSLSAFISSSGMPNCSIKTCHILALSTESYAFYRSINNKYAATPEFIHFFIRVDKITQLSSSLQPERKPPCAMARNCCLSATVDIFAYSMVAQSFAKTFITASPR